MFRLFDFICSSCGEAFEDLVRPGNPATCPVCGNTHTNKKIITGCNFKLPSNDPGFPGAYAKWGEDRMKRVRQERKNMDSFGEHKQSVKEI